MSGPVYIDWYAKDALDGMNQLAPLEELAYRRIIDMIYASDNTLLDDDESLKWSTKTGAKWPKIKQRLLLMNKIEIVDGRITNKNCTEKLEQSHARISQKSVAGKASSEKRKRQKNNNTGSTAVGTSEPTNHQSSIINTSVTNVTGQDELASGPDFKKSLFTEGLKLLGGKNPDKNRSLVGRWLRDYGEQAVIDAFLTAQKESAVEPRAYIEKILKGGADAKIGRQAGGGYASASRRSDSWQSEGERLAAKYRAEAERERQGPTQ